MRGMERPDEQEEEDERDEEAYWDRVISRRELELSDPPDDEWRIGQDRYEKWLNRISG